MFQGESNSKKTDDYTADDVPAEEEQAPVRPKSKLDLNEPEMAAEEEEEESNEDQEQVEVKPEEVEVKPSEPASRKRKPRKE